jgi:peptide/nickel transport system substrate-binding protein
MDRQEMVDTIQYGAVPVAHVFVTPDEPEYRFIEDSIVKYDFDPRRAAQMIEQLGYTRGSNNLFQQGGQTLSVEIRATGTDLNQKLMHAIGDYWRSVGVGVEETPIPPQRANDLEYRATFPGFNVQMQGGEMTFVANFHTSQLRTPENRYAGNNNARYSNRELDDLIDRYQSTIELADRMRVSAAAVRHITENVVELPIFYNAAPALIGRGITNVGAPRGAPTAWNVHLWDIQ